jgi:hypothetical protein
VRESDGKTVSLKDGRIVAAGIDLKQRFPNTYRNTDNERTFYGKHLNLGEAYKLACLVQYGPNMPIETSGHFSMRTALLRTAAYYALTDEELKEILEDPSLAEFLYFLIKSAKQIVYTFGVEARLIFGDSVFSRHPPAKLLRGTSNIVSVHYAVTVFSNPLFSMQSIWVWQSIQPSWIARIGKSQGLTEADDINVFAPYQRLLKRGVSPNPNSRVKSRPKVRHSHMRRNRLLLNSTTWNFTR